ncbi:MAG: hypothetical protein Q9212_003140, partial [Teloschistes hypoglaucus]
VHQIQSGQVIVDLCSVVKELVENSLDAGATSIEVRFKANGLESIEVQDNGSGISKENYETIALKHYTSKLATYDDLSSLNTFGFRGEALSSLCALSNFHILTAQPDEAPKGTRLDFETSGRLRATSVVASQRGTTVVVESLFANLPVRRRELERNIKREYGKVISLLQAYACISTSVKLSVSNIMVKGKKAVVFATKSNAATRDNVANVFGAKTLSALVSMNLEFELQQTRRIISHADVENIPIRVVGHVSRPVFGEGRQTPDRQMFFVNSRPCNLPQFAKVFNEVYKSYNLSQSPFVFANIIINTNAYDVNVSPDKRTILLHEQTALLDSLRNALTDLFEEQDHTIPQAQRLQPRLPAFKQLTVTLKDSGSEDIDGVSSDEAAADIGLGSDVRNHEGDTAQSRNEPAQKTASLINKFASRDVRERTSEKGKALRRPSIKSLGEQTHARASEYSICRLPTGDEDQGATAESDTSQDHQESLPNHDDFNKRMAEQRSTRNQDEDIPSQAANTELNLSDEAVPSVASSPAKPARDSGIVQNTFDRMRPRRALPQIATITIGDRTTTTVIGSSSSRPPLRSPASPRRGHSARPTEKDSLERSFSSSMQAFAAPGSQMIEAIDTSLTAPRHVRKSNETPLFSQLSTASTQYSEGDSEGESSQCETDAVEDRELGDDVVNDELLSDEVSDEEYVNDEDRKEKQDAQVAKLIQRAEKQAAMPTQDNLQRARRILQGRGLKHSTTNLLQTLHTFSCQRLEDQLQTFERDLQQSLKHFASFIQLSHLDSEEIAEQTLDLTILKDDFFRMRIIGQFNLGFILAVRPSTSTAAGDELFIIDQHASDEKYNFERLQATIVIQNQRLVKPKILDLTAVEEEIVIENQAALTANGFIVDVDESGDEPVGSRCKLLSLPMTKETTFSLPDLEELIALLGDSPHSTSNLTTQPPTSPNTISSTQIQEHIPRPSRTRRLLASRACRSSIMIGKTLQKRQMQTVVRHMGEIEKPWNCPHGRPTMRHLLGLGGWVAWEEGDGLADEVDEGKGGKGIDWQGWLDGRKEVDGVGVEGFAGGEEDGDEESGDDDQEGQDEEVEEGDDVDMAEHVEDGLDVEEEKNEKGREVDHGDQEEGSQSEGERKVTDRMGSISQRFRFS